MKKVVHIITSLDRHGTQNFLLKLANYQFANKYNVQIIVLKKKWHFNRKF